MDIRTFITETLVQIVGGVAEAKAQIAEMNNGAAVNPTLVSYSEQKPLAQSSAVEFDIAVTVASSSQDAEAAKAGGAFGGVLAVVGVRIGAEIGSESTRLERSEAISRIKFSVNISQPADIERSAPPAPIPSSRYT